MKAFLKELKFPSTKHTYIKDITPEVKSALEKSKVKNGLMIVNTRHTTLGIIVQEIAEPNFLEDVLEHCLQSVYEDRRSDQVTSEFSYPTTLYQHYAQDHPYCDDIDDDYDAAGHIRSMIYSHPSVSLPIRGGKLELGKYQEVAIMEFDGRDGTGKNPIRQRTVQIWIYQVEEIKRLD